MFYLIQFTNFYFSDELSTSLERLKLAAGEDTSTKDFTSHLEELLNDINKQG